MSDATPNMVNNALNLHKFMVFSPTGEIREVDDSEQELAQLASQLYHLGFFVSTKSNSIGTARPATPSLLTDQETA